MIVPEKVNLVNDKEEKEGERNEMVERTYKAGGKKKELPNWR
jgi:hypothetical protein